MVPLPLVPLPLEELAAMEEELNLEVMEEVTGEIVTEVQADMVCVYVI